MLYWGVTATQFSWKGASSLCLGKLTQPFCHSYHSVLLFSCTRITGYKLWWICPCKHPPGFSWRWMTTSKATEAITVELTAGCSEGEHPPNAKIWTGMHNVEIQCKSGYLTYFHVSSVWCTHAKHPSAEKEAAPCDWQTPSLPVYVALHLFAPSLGYFSRRSHVWGPACVPCIQMEAAVCKVSVRGEWVRGSRWLTSFWRKTVWVMQYIDFFN